jgi:hypothetical protein
MCSRSHVLFPRCPRRVYLRMRFVNAVRARYTRVCTRSQLFDSCVRVHVSSSRGVPRVCMRLRTIGVSARPAPTMHRCSSICQSSVCALTLSSSLDTVHFVAASYTAFSLLAIVAGLLLAGLYRTWHRDTSAPGTRSPRPLWKAHQHQRGISSRTLPWHILQAKCNAWIRPVVLLVLVSRGVR